MRPQVGDMWPTDQPTPAGYEWIKDRVDSVGFRVMKAMVQSGQEPAFELRVADGVLLPVATSDWLSPFCDEMLGSGFKLHYFSPEMPDDPAIARKVFSYGSEWRKLFVRCSAAEPAPADQRVSPKRLAVLEAVTALYGSVAGCKSIAVKTRDAAINKWLKANGRGGADPKTIRQALPGKREKKGK
jgi:hypothetical protein